MTEPLDRPPYPESPGGLKKADLLLVLPFIWQLGFASWANGVAWAPLGLPFPMVWQMAGIVFATGILALRYRLDRARRAAENAA